MCLDLSGAGSVHIVYKKNVHIYDYIEKSAKRYV